MKKILLTDILINLYANHCYSLGVKPEVNVCIGMENSTRLLDIFCFGSDKLNLELPNSYDSNNLTLIKNTRQLMCWNGKFRKLACRS